MALVAEDGREFYAELTDYDQTQVFPWLQDNVLSKLILTHGISFDKRERGVYLVGTRQHVKTHLDLWLKQFSAIEIWSDVLAYDWVLFCDLWDGARNLPSNIFYAPFDLATIFRMKGLINPISNYEMDFDRYKYAGINGDLQHNALFDARTELVCFSKIM